MAIIEVPDILLYKDTTWKSIANQKSFVNGQWYNIGVGSGIYKDNNWYVLSKDIDSMILEYTINSSPLTITLPLYGNVNCDVDWGDGNINRNSTIEHYEYELEPPTEEEIENGTMILKISSSLPEHTYNNVGTYYVKITGKVTKINGATIYIPAISRNALTKVVSWGNLQTEDMTYAFRNCENLREISSPSSESFSKVKIFNHSFYGDNLVSIPEDFFNNCPVLVDVYSCFDANSSLTSIPSGLFRNCPQITNFGYCFSGCENLTGYTPFDILPDGSKLELWERAGKEGYPTSINGQCCFQNCKNLSNFQKIPNSGINSWR